MSEGLGDLEHLVSFSLGRKTDLHRWSSNVIEEIALKEINWKVRDFLAFSSSYSHLLLSCLIPQLKSPISHSNLHKCHPEHSFFPALPAYEGKR